MSKESNTNQRNVQAPAMPSTLRTLAADIFGDEPVPSLKKNVPKTEENEVGTNNNEVSDNTGLIDFRNFLEEYKNGEDTERIAIYVTPEIKDVIDRLKASRVLKKYSLKDIVNSIFHAYILEHRAEINQILSPSKNNILD